MLDSDVFFETKPYIHAMKQHVIKLMALCTFNANLDQSHVQHLGQWQETLTLLHSNKLVLRCNEQLQLLVLK